MRLFQPIVTLSLARLVAAQSLIAHLDYGSFQGAYNAEYNISYWQKIPYAAPPVGENRFRAPQPPLPIGDQVYNSSQPFDMCPQRTVNGSEDCLYLGLYSRPWTEGQPLRPVVVTFYGGAFVQGSASFTIPPPAYPILNVSSSSSSAAAFPASSSSSNNNDKKQNRGDGGGMLFVYPNYRVNAFGFLPGRQVAADPHSDPNAGLLDQDMALRWTQKHIRRFGGDPARVTIWGQSAGGGSVVAQTMAAAAAAAVSAEAPPPPLFRQALASSPFWPKTYRNEAPEAQWRYDQLVNLTGCGGISRLASDADADDASNSLRCLKHVDVQTLREASLQIAASHTYTTSSNSWGPVIDDTFLPQPLSEVITTATAAAAPGWINGIQLAFFATYNTHEGENFIPPGLGGAASTGDAPFNASVASFREWVAGYLPGFSGMDLQRLEEELYPESGWRRSTDGSPDGYNDTYTRAGLVYRDSVLACPAYWMTGAATKGGWLGEYTIAPAKHGSDVYWWNSVNSAQQTDRLHYEGYAGAMHSFFMTGDPNAMKLTPEDIPDVPPLKSGLEYVVNERGFSTAGLARFRERCDFWLNVAPRVPI